MHDRRAAMALILTLLASTALAAPQRQAVQPPATVEEAVAIVDAYLNGIQTLQADFVQVGGDGKRSSGRLALQRPGRLRFAYASPSVMEVVADGRSVAVRDRRLATQDLYAIGQTPLKFLLGRDASLARDAKVLGAGSDNGVLSLRLEDRSTIGGTSRVTIELDLGTGQLKGWRVVDPQGYSTSVSLRNIDVSTPPDPSWFAIDYQRRI